MKLDGFATLYIDEFLALERFYKGKDSDGVAAYRRSNYRLERGNKRPSAQSFGGGIV